MRNPNIKDIFVDSKVAQILQYVFELSRDWCIEDVRTKLYISRKTADKYVACLLYTDVISYTRTVGKSQMYARNGEHPIWPFMRKLKQMSDSINYATGKEE